MSIFIIRQTLSLYGESTAVIGYVSSQYEADEFLRKKNDCLERMTSKLLDFHTNAFMDWKESHETLRSTDVRRYNHELSDFLKAQINEILEEDEYQMHVSLVDYAVENRYYNVNWDWEEIQPLE